MVNPGKISLKSDTKCEQCEFRAGICLQDGFGGGSQGRSGGADIIKKQYPLHGLMLDIANTEDIFCVGNALVMTE